MSVRSVKIPAEGHDSMREKALQLTGREHWRSLDQLAGSEEFRGWVEREFPENATELSEPSRRGVLKLMAASLGLAGLTACRRPVERILPFSRGVEDLIPGKAVYYATSMPLGGVSTGLLVESNDGRPTKIEGNPKHPSSLGACSAYAQASVLGLYDPDRSQAVYRDGKRSSWEDFQAFAGPHFSDLGDGAGLRFLSEPVSSPSLEAVRSHALRKFPKAKWSEYAPLDSGAANAGCEIAFGKQAGPRFVLRFAYDKADVILSLDHDFLGLDEPTTIPTREFSRRRRVTSEKDSMNRLYMVEAQYSVTGAMADHRLRMRLGDVRKFAEALAEELWLLPPKLRVLNNGQSKEERWVSALARDLKANAGRCLVVAGPRQPAAVHALTYWINETLGNLGETVFFAETGTGEIGDGQNPQPLGELAAEMDQGQVDTLMILGGNPVYNAPADFDFAAHLKKVASTIHLGLERDETAVLCQWHLPEAHYLESWGDGRAHDGTVTLQQPLIQPLYEGKSASEVLAMVSGYPDQRGYDIVRNYWLSQWNSADGEKTWRRCLHDGLAPDTAYPTAALPKLDAKAVRAALQAPPANSDRIEVGFYPDSGVYDGRFTNNGWLQEAPDPMTKLTWDNAALMSSATASSLDVASGDVISIEAGGRETTMPVFVQPGHANRSISLALGYGRTQCGRVGQAVGGNAYLIRTAEGAGFLQGARVRKTGRKHVLASTQEHQSMEGRPLVREATLEDYTEHPNFATEAVEHPPLLSLYEEPSYDQGYQWGMAIDLNSCVGCNACLVACQSENNIPVVGKDEVLRGREMHWIRLDRYYAGDPEDPQAVSQPVNCQQCENAPCENVCPVAATVHTPEGLNDMAYNRCVGTRYCANNCPYKVRRFNFFDFSEGLAEVQKMAFNPNVTVRVRGVMEKCTYCVQRIQEKKITSRAEGRSIEDGEIKTACQQTCPAEAIVFGDINDSESRVSKLKGQNRDYAMLGELNTKPRTTYLAKLRNPNPELS